VFALRESSADSLDVLSGELVAHGVAVLICHHALTAEAIEFARQNKERFNSARWYVMGMGRGANRALELSDGEIKFKAVLALAPFVDENGGRPGLRWLRETDWLSALNVIFERDPLAPLRGDVNALVVYGDEDRLNSITMAREIFPNLLTVAGARHLTLAAMPATLALAADAFEVHLQPALKLMRVPARRPIVGGEFGE
jgi:hypothetical protein